MTDRTSDRHGYRRIRDRARKGRNLLLLGALSGLGIGLVGLLGSGGNVSGETAALARIALIVPVVIYILWWAFSPGLTHDIVPIDQDSEVEGAAAHVLAHVFDAPPGPGFAVRRGDAAAVFSGRIVHPGSTVPDELRPAFRRTAGEDSAASGT